MIMRLYSEIICKELNSLFSLLFVGQIIIMRRHNSYLAALISKKILIPIHYKLFHHKVYLNYEKR